MLEQVKWTIAGVRAPAAITSVMWREGGKVDGLWLRCQCRSHLVLILPSADPQPVAEKKTEEGIQMANSLWGGGKLCIIDHQRNANENSNETIAYQK